MEGEQRESIPDGLGYGTEGGGEAAAQPEGGEGGQGGGGEQTASNPDRFFDIDELASETDRQLGNKEEDPFTNDLGWGEANSEEEEEDETTGSGEGEEGAGEGDGEGSGEGTGEGESGSGEGEASGDKPEGEGSGEGEGSDDTANEDEPLYDAQRDFPDEEVTPTVYKDRVKLNEGVSAKINHARKLKQQLEEMESGVGAIRLPKLFNGSEEFLDNPFDRSEFSDVENDQAKQAVFELDRFIKDVGNKINVVENRREQEQQKTQVSQEYQEALDTLVQDLNMFGIDANQAQKMRMDTLFDKLDQQVEDFEGEAGEEFLEENGLPKYTKRLRELEKARDRVKKFPEIAQKQQNLKQKKTDPKSTQVDPAKVKNSYQEMREDRGDHEVFQTKETERAFLEWMENEVFKGQRDPAQSPREWVNAANDYQELVDQERKKYLSKSDKKKPEGKDTKEKNDNRADKSGKRKPPAQDIKTDKNERGGDRITTFDVEDEMAQLAKEMDS